MTSDPRHSADDERPEECPTCLGFGYLMEHDGLGGTVNCPTCTAHSDGWGVTHPTDEDVGIG